MVSLVANVAWIWGGGEDSGLCHVVISRLCDKKGR